MKNHSPHDSIKNNMLYWVTIEESVDIINNHTDLKIKNYDIYRHALYGNIILSIYFQPLIKLRKIITSSDGSIQFEKCNGDVICRLCHLNKFRFINNENIELETEGDYIPLSSPIMDTPLIGHEYAQ